MTSVRSRKRGGKTYHYLVHTFRVGTEVRSVEAYLGTTLPSDISAASDLLLRQEWAIKWYPEFDRIRTRHRERERRLPPEIRQKNLENFVIRFTYDTNRIEGSSLTLRDTTLLIQDGISPESKPISDVIESRSHAKIFTRMLLSNDQSLPLKRILAWHKDIFNETKPNLAGSLRNYRVAIGQSRFSPPDPSQVPKLMRDLLRWRARSLRTLHPVHIAAIEHLRFEAIHPFGDGNGRIGRLLLNFELNRAGYPLFNLEFERRGRYYDALESSQVEMDERPFVSWFFREYARQYRGTDD